MDDELKNFLKQFEDQKSTVYKDSVGLPTVGVGANLNSPEVAPILKTMGTSKKDVLSGAPLSPEQQNELLQKQIDEKRTYLQNIQKKDFPDSDIPPHQERALLSLGFNSPKLWGPSLRSSLKENRDLDAGKEILLRSNLKKEGGVQRRRLKEAEMFMGDQFQSLVDSLSPEEAVQIHDILNSIKNPHTREQIIQEYPFLKAIVKPNRFNKIK